MVGAVAVAPVPTDHIIGAILLCATLLLFLLDKYKKVTLQMSLTAACHSHCHVSLSLPRVTHCHVPRQLSR